MKSILLAVGLPVIVFAMLPAAYADDMIQSQNLDRLLEEQSDVIASGMEKRIEAILRTSDAPQINAAPVTRAAAQSPTANTARDLDANASAEHWARAIFMRRTVSL